MQTLISQNCNALDSRRLAGAPDAVKNNSHSDVFEFLRGEQIDLSSELLPSTCFLFERVNAPARLLSMAVASRRRLPTLFPLSLSLSLRDMWKAFIVIPG